MPKPSDPTVLGDFKVFFFAMGICLVMLLGVLAIHGRDPKPRCPSGLTYIPRIQACLSGAALPTFTQ